MVARECPPRKAWQEFLQGRLAEDLSSHLEGCRSCLESLHALEMEDTFVEALRRPVAPVDEAGGALLARLRNRLGMSNLALAASSLVAEETSEIEQRQEPPSTPPAEATAELYGFLSPAEHSDELGRLGPYRVLKVLGQGGMGVVFHAEDPRLKRSVALKIMKSSAVADESARLRFLREAQAAASLQHDHVISIYHVGEDRDVVYAAMPLLRGQSLEQRLRNEGKLSIFETLRIGREIALGLRAAHDRGLIHRDIKPANIWLERVEEGAEAGGGRVKILDFGLARTLTESFAGQKSTDRSENASQSPAPAPLTQDGVIVGTPAYMAPEQAEGRFLDPRCDLFSLGCVLYRLCTGALPFQGNSVAAMLRAVARQTPPPPRALNPAVPRQLEALILELLAKAPEERARSAELVVERIKRIEKDLARRHRRRRLFWPIAVLLLSAVGLAGYFAIPYFFRAPEQGGRAIEADHARRPSVPDAVSATYGELRTLDGHGGTVWAVAAGGKNRVLSAGGDRTISVWDADTGEEIQRLKGHGSPIRCLAVSGDGRFALSGGGGKDGRPSQAVFFWDLAEGKGFPLSPTHAAGIIGIGVRAGDQKACSAGQDGMIYLWDLKKRELEGRFQLDSNDVSCLAISADGTRLAIGTGDIARLLDADTGKEIVRLVGHLDGIRALAFSPDGQRIASGSLDHTVRLWNSTTGEELHSYVGHESWVNSVAFDLDGKRILSCSSDKTLRFWDLEGKREPLVLNGHQASVQSVAFLCDGLRFVSGSTDQTVRIWGLSGK